MRDGAPLGTCAGFSLTKFGAVAPPGVQRTRYEPCAPGLPLRNCIYRAANLAPKLRVRPASGLAVQRHEFCCALPKAHIIGTCVARGFRQMDGIGKSRKTILHISLPRCRAQRTKNHGQRTTDRERGVESSSETSRDLHRGESRSYSWMLVLNCRFLRVLCVLVEMFEINPG